MIAEIISGSGQVRYVESPPRCGDFCDTCGDCLHCYSDAGYYPCPDGHRWVLYYDLDAERIAEIESAHSSPSPD